jgi:RNA polymerase sigma-70 factor (ECF subfamily)
MKAQSLLYSRRPARLGEIQMPDLPLARRRPVSESGDEAALVNAAVRGDAAAFGELYRRYVPRVYRYLYSHVGEQVDAEDLTAQAFTAAWEGIARYREQGNFAAWLFRIARNKANDYYRRRRSQMSLDEAHSLLLEDWDPQSHMEQSELLRRLSDLISQLDREQAELLRLRFAADMSYAEMASLLGRSEPAVKMSVHRLLRHLQVALEKDNG